MTDISTCGHKFCSCPTTSDNKYCSDHCEKAADHDKPEIACDCGHEDCE